MNSALQQAIKLHQSGRAAEALPYYEQALAANPSDLAALYYGGVAAWSTGNAALAVERLGQVISLSPQPVADAYYHRGLAHTALGATEQAIADYSTAASLKPAFAPAHNNLGELLRQSGQLDAADAAFAAALRHDPALNAARHNRGLTALQRGDAAAARDLLKECVQREPDSVAARASLVDALLDLAQQSDALALARAGVKRLPAAAPLWNALGHAEQAAGHIDDALAAFARAHALQPSSAEFALNLAHLQNENADSAGAAATYANAGPDLPGHGGLAFRLATLLPAIPASEAAIDEARTRFVSELARLRERGVKLTDPLNEYGDTPFYLSYHGRDDDRVLLGELAGALRSAAPSLAFRAPHCDGRPRRGGKLRVGFCSQFLFDQSVGRAMRAIIRGLPRRDVDVHILRVPPHFRDAVSAAIDTDATVHQLPFDLAAARERIATLELDLLVFPEIGMDALTYYLAHARLAPRQWTTLGHPCTSGLPEIDAYVSYAALEAAGADRLYSEQLMRIPAGAIYPDYPAAPATARTDREALGLPASGTLFICPQSLFKLMPRFDQTIAAILDAVPDAALLLPQSNWPGQTEALRGRLRAAAGATADRIIYFPRRSRADFVALVNACDVLLDPFPVGGGITTWDALATGTPIVTLPGELMRSRFAESALVQAGLSSTVAADAADYVAIARRIATDCDEATQWRLRMRDAAPAIYRDQRAVDGWVSAVMQIAA